MTPLIISLLFLLQNSLLSTSSTPPPPAAAETPKFACEPPHHNTYLFCNTTLPFSTRAQSLISLLTLSEKIILLSDSAAAVPRLGLPAYEWWSESLHGVAVNGPGVNFQGPIKAATGFPQVILTTASFNRTLWSLIAVATAKEARAMYNRGQAGLTFWAPNVNIFRDPRWGRGQETPGEDPMVASAYAVAYVRGFQGEYGDVISTEVKAGEESRVLKEREGRRLMVSACCKHYAAYDLEKWGNVTRYTFNAKVTKQDMEDTYQPPFQSCVQEGRATCLMCSYNELNGVPLCADRDLLERARHDWGFQGYITSDCNAVATIFEYQNYTKSPVDAVALALKAGVDINCGGYYTRYAKPALDSGKVQAEDIDRALLNLFLVQLRLGFFDGDPLNQQFGSLGPEDICTAKHQQLALEAARQGIVLLKNDNASLPLARVKSLAVVGPIADKASKLGGDYTGVSCTEISILDALRSHISNVSFAAGCLDGIACTSASGFDAAVHIATEEEAVVVVVGLDLMQEDEELDRVSLLLPGKQADLVAAVAKVSRRPIVLVLVGGGPMDVSFAEEHPRIGSILWVGYPGEAGPQAVAEAILGGFNPGGRLPMTWYPESFMSVPMDDMHIRPDPSRDYPGRTYRFYTGPVLYKFGHGLSYSDYKCEYISVPDKVSLTAATHIQQVLRHNGLDQVAVNQLAGFCNMLKFTVRISVKNDGLMDGSHVVLLFSRSATNKRGTPLKQLVGFERVKVVAGQAAEATIVVEPCTHMSTADETGQLVLLLGAHVLMLESGVEHLLTIDI